MKYFCNGCKTEINLKADRVAGHYVYECSCCGRNLRKADMINDAQIERKLSRKTLKQIENTHPCSSCDEVVPIDEMDNCGRCSRCQEEYPLD